MPRFKLQSSLLVLCLFGISSRVCAQISPDCSTAVPICSNTPVNGGTQGYGIDDFSGALESGCLETTQSGFIESNAAWYRFRTGAAGQLGFNISFDPSEDWDFALYRATDCSALGEPVRCNFFDNQDRNTYMGVGEDPTGDTSNVQYEPWLDVQPGEDYLLLINNFSNTNSGFSIQFSGEIFITNPFDALDCSIVTNLLGPPVAACDGDVITLDATTTGAAAYEWYADTGFGFVLLAGEAQPTLDVSTSAIYRVRVLMPDGTQEISDVQVGFDPIPMASPIIDDILACGENIEHSFEMQGQQALGALDPDRYRISWHNTAAEALSGANPIRLPYVNTRGRYEIYVRITSNANPDCFDSGQSFTLDILSDPLGEFDQEVYLCSGGSVEIGTPLNDPDAEYSWSTGETTPRITVDQPGTYTLSSFVEGPGGSCGQGRPIVVIEQDPPSISSIDITGEAGSYTITVNTEAQGNYEYALNNGLFQEEAVFTDVPAGEHIVRMRGFNDCGEVSEVVSIMGFPKFFTPNADGINDQWAPSGLEEFQDPVISIFDRYGKLLAQLHSDNLAWDGNFNGQPMPATDYWFRLDYTDASGQRVQARFLSAHFTLKR